MDVTELLAFSAKQGASDLHLSAGLPPMIRVDGDVRRINLPPMEHNGQALIYEIMNDKQRKDYEFWRPTSPSRSQLSPASASTPSIRTAAPAPCSTIPSKVLTMEDLGMGQVFIDIAERARGVVLVTGPTGSGKSTTLAAMIDFISSNKYEHIPRSRIRSSSYTNEEVPGEPARGAPGHARLHERCARRCVRTRTSSSSANCVT